MSGGMSPDMPPAAPDHAIGVAFWLAFTMHAAIGEWWLRRRPAIDG